LKVLSGGSFSALSLASLEGQLLLLLANCFFQGRIVRIHFGLSSCNHLQLAENLLLSENRIGLQHGKKALDHPAEQIRRRNSSGEECVRFASVSCNFR
jgi:hypothetical protein